MDGVDVGALRGGGGVGGQDMMPWCARTSLGQEEEEEEEGGGTPRRRRRRWEVGLTVLTS